MYLAKRINMYPSKLHSKKINLIHNYVGITNSSRLWLDDVWHVYLFNWLSKTISNQVKSFVSCSGEMHSNETFHSRFRPSFLVTIVYKSKTCHLQVYFVRRNSIFIVSNSLVLRWNLLCVNLINSFLLCSHVVWYFQCKYQQMLKAKFNIPPTFTNFTNFKFNTKITTVHNLTFLHFNVYFFIVLLFFLWCLLTILSILIKQLVNST